MSFTDEIRARIRALTAVACDAIPAVWPIGGFIATNPLGGYEHLTFRDAIALARTRTRARGFLPEADYRRRYMAGAISAAALDAALDHAMEMVPNEHRLLLGRTASARDIVRLSLITDVTSRTEQTELDAAVRARLSSLADVQNDHRGEGRAAPPAHELTVAELVDALCGTNLTEIIDDRTILWCGAFLDQGEAAWSMPYRELGLYAAWRRLAPYDASSAALAIDGYRRRVRESFAQPEDAIVSALSTMRVERASWERHLTRHAARLPGWAGIAKWRAANATDPSQQAAPIDAVQYLALRLWYEAALVGTVADRYGIPPTTEAFISHFGAPQPVTAALDASDVLANIATQLELSATEVFALGDDDLRWLLRATRALDDEQRGLIWLEANEAHVRDAMLNAIASRPQPISAAPRADVVFCIDVRSEGYRRHLESVGPYRTRGFAGFYGLPIAFQSVDSAWSQQACPVLIAPKHRIVERATGAPNVARRHRRARSFLFELRRILDEVKGSAASPFVLFESIGAFFVVPLACRTLLPRGFGALRASVKRAMVPQLPTAFTVAKARDDDATVGFTSAERLFFAESSLALMGMRDDFARLVLLVGHGSTTENNPFEASLDCGACAGYRGGPNARILAAMLNREDVRAGLVARGINIPSSTVFVGAEHDTAIDRIDIRDADLVPVSHRPDLTILKRDLDVAGGSLAAERVRALRRSHARQAAAHVETRSRDWAQVRPEWGLARNAAFVIAPRSFTAGVDLGTRAFLHEYDVAGDADGALLEIIMTAPLVVAQWINNHYYFATVDNERYGSGTKVIHNVVARIGVMSGNRSDLRAGLPLQSLADGGGWYHEPLRLLAIVTAPRARIDAVVDRNAVLQRLLHNEWIALVAWDPDTQIFWAYRSDATWEPHLPYALETTSAPIPAPSAA